MQNMSKTSRIFHQNNVINLLDYKQTPDINYKIGQEFSQLKMFRLAAHYINRAIYQDKSFRNASNFTTLASIYSLVADEEKNYEYSNKAMCMARKALSMKDAFTMSDITRIMLLNIIFKYTTSMSDISYIKEFLNMSKKPISSDILAKNSIIAISNSRDDSLFLLRKYPHSPPEIISILTRLSTDCIPDNIVTQRAKHQSILNSIYRESPGPFQLDNLVKHCKRIHSPFVFQNENNAELFSSISKTFTKIAHMPEEYVSSSPDCQKIGFVCDDLSFDSTICRLLCDFMILLSEKYPDESVVYFTSAKPDGKYYATRLKNSKSIKHILLPESTLESVNVIRSQCLNVCIFPSTNSNTREFFIANSRVSSIQIALWTNSCTTGIPNMDIFITAGQSTNKSYYTEQIIVNMQSSPIFFMRDPVSVIFEKQQMLPLTNLHKLFNKLDSRLFDVDSQIYSCVHNKISFTQEFVTMLCRILIGNSNALLLLTEQQYNDGKIFEWLKKLLPYETFHSRIITIPVLPIEAYLCLITNVKVALDPYPANGIISTLEFMSLGIPIITGNLENCFTSCLYKNYDVYNRLVASDIDDYVDKAINIVKNNYELTKNTIKKISLEIFENKRSFDEFYNIKTSGKNTEVSIVGSITPPDTHGEVLTDRSA